MLHKLISSAMRYDAWLDIQTMRAVNRACRKTGDNAIIYTRKEVRQTLLARYGW